MFPGLTKRSRRPFRCGRDITPDVYGSTRWRRCRPLIGGNLIGTARAGGHSAGKITPFVVIAPDSSVTVLSKHLDKGQGSRRASPRWSPKSLMRLGPDQGRVRAANAALYNNLSWGPIRHRRQARSSIPMSSTGRPVRPRGRCSSAAAAYWGAPEGEVTVEAGDQTQLRQDPGVRRCRGRSLRSYRAGDGGAQVA